MKRKKKKEEDEEEKKSLPQFMSLTEGGRCWFPFPL